MNLYGTNDEPIWMIMRNLLISLSMFSGIMTPFSGMAESSTFQRPFYVGAKVGIGSTTWMGLVPPTGKQNINTSTVTPIEVEEGGTVWVLTTGYEFTPYFALEANYRFYPRANVIFDEYSIFAFEHDQTINFNTYTTSLDLMAKVMLIIPKTTLRLFSSAGVARVNRWDSVARKDVFTPTFGAGFNYSFTEHLMAELGFNYTAGYAESELNPALDYVPFLYSGFLGLSYRV